MFQNKNINNKLNRNNNNVLNKNLNKKISNNLFTKEYEINDVRISIRNILTKGQTHDEISQYSGASISTRGRYISPSDKNRGNIHDRPLYLFIQGNSKNDIDLAIQKIEEIIHRESSNNQIQMPQKFPKFQTNRNQQAPNMQQGIENNSLLIEKIMVGLDHAPDAFDLKGRVVGAGGANLHYIRNETGAMATLRGKGTGFMESHLGGYESNEHMHLYIEHTNFNGLQAAKQLAKNLIETIQQELVHFQQMNPPMPANVQITSQPTLVHSEIFQPQQQAQQISISQSLLAVPPPIVQHNGIIQQPPPQTILQQQNFLQQNPGQTLLPIQIHHQQGNNMVIQQTEQSTNPIGNLSIPPPGIHMPMKAGQLVQIQGTTPHLSHPPPNIQIQSQQQPTQILLNQAPPNYQFQYVQQTQQQNPNDQQPQQVTIQHIYQTPQQIHGIVQQASIPQQFDQIQVRGQQIQTTQQYIALPGNTTAFMMPPPNIIQSHQPRPIQNVIYSSQPHQLHYTMPNEITINQNNIPANSKNINDSSELINNLKDDKKLEILNNNKNGGKCEDHFATNKKPPKSTSPQQSIQTPISLSFTQMPPPIPPPSIQQIVEQQHNQTICHQVPVSIAQQHQIQITTNPNVTTSNFIINGPQWTQQPQQPPPPHSQNNNQIIQNNQMIHLAAQPPQHHPQFRNSQDGQFYSGIENYQNQQMQIQFHQAGPPPPPPPIIQQINVEQQHQQQFGPQLPPPHRFHMQQQNFHLIDNKMNQQRIMHQIDSPGNQQHIGISQQQQQGNNGTQIPDTYKMNRKRKSENEGEPPTSVPKMGMGLIINERDNQRIVVADHPPPIISSNSNTSTITTTTTRTASTNLSDDTNEMRSQGFIGGANPNASPSSTNSNEPPSKQSKQNQQQESPNQEKSQYFTDKFYEGRPIHPGQQQHPPHKNSGQHKDNYKMHNRNNHNNGPTFMMGGGQQQPQPPHMDDNRHYSIETLPPPVYPHRGIGNPNGMGGGGDPRYRGQW